MRRARGTPLAPSRGFTLLEVMVALALLAAALVAVADLCGNALRNHAYARDLSAATLLARGKMAELTQKYEDQGFKDFDEQEDGDFAQEGRADLRWHLVLVKPDPDLSADQIVTFLSGSSDPNELAAKLMGGGGSAQDGSTRTTSASPLLGAATSLLQTQLSAFGEIVKRSLREMRLTVSWRDGATPHGFTVTTHLLVLNPRAPGGARGDDPEIPSQIASLSSSPILPSSGAGTTKTKP